MARCIRCGKLKSDFRKEKHEQKMMAREVSESAEN
jgi:small nuclear ribonucleoprotein